MTTAKKSGAALRTVDAEARREAARLLGAATSERKRQTSAENGRKSVQAENNGRPRRPLSEIPCTCGRGEALEGHPTTCARGRAIRRRQKAGQPLT